MNLWLQLSVSVALGLIAVSHPRHTRRVPESDMTLYRWIEISGIFDLAALARPSIRKTVGRQLREGEECP